VCSQRRHFYEQKSTNYYGKDVIISSFHIGEYEVTQKEWIEVMRSNPSKFKGHNPPVEMVSWYDCIESISCRCPYQVQWSSNLTANSWNILVRTNLSLTATNETIQTMDSGIFSQPPRFYEVKTPAGG